MIIERDHHITKNMSHCALSARIESVLFATPVPARFEIPDEACPICLCPLRETSTASCCGGYARKLKCGHFVHVSCQIDRNPDMLRCSVCRQTNAIYWVYYRVIHAVLCRSIPPHYQAKFMKKTLTPAEFNDIKNYGVDPDEVAEACDKLARIRDDEEALRATFAEIWRK